MYIHVKRLSHVCQWFHEGLIFLTLKYHLYHIFIAFSNYYKETCIYKYIFT